MNEPNLSYVLTTRNRLGFLRVVLSRLVERRLDDEEIVVIDGASTDGTVQFLEDLLQAGQIQQLWSESDRGEAHGLNRGCLVARGRLLKPLSDDDAHYWQGIQACKQFMLSHAEIDVLGSNGGGNDWQRPERFEPFEYQDKFLRWRESRACFEFCGLGLMIRRGSLPLVGLFNPAFVRVDMEYSLRITQGPCRLAWHLGSDYLRLAHSESGGILQTPRLADEAIYLAVHEGSRGVRPNLASYPPPVPFARQLRCRVGHLRRRIAPTTSSIDRQSATLNTLSGPDEWYSLFLRAEEWLVERNRQSHGFLL